jgi:hypothetical protein
LLFLIKREREKKIITVAAKWHVVPALDDDECGAIGGTTSREIQITCRKPTPVLLCPQQISHHMNRA